MNGLFIFFFDLWYIWRDFAGYWQWLRHAHAHTDTHANTQRKRLTC